MAEPTAADLRRMTLKVIDAEEVTVTTSGTCVNPSSNTDAVAVRVINNTSNIVMVGMDATHVDGSSSPKLGFPLAQYDSRLFYVEDNANEVQIDASADSTQVSIEILGRS